MIPWVYFLKEDEQLLVESFTRRFTVEGPSVYVTNPLSRVKLRKGLTLGPLDYLRIRDNISGKIRMEQGPTLFFLKVTEEVLAQLKAIPLKHNQYLKLLDNQTGIIRVERGEKAVFIGPTEEILQKVTEGISIDDHQGVLIRDTKTGNLDLITSPQVFIPSQQQEIVEIRKRILLENHETVVIKDQNGRYQIRRGTDKESGFFLSPYTELVEFYWSTGIHKDKRTLRLTHLDNRPKFMWYEFECRTQDNVELTMGITFFWQIEKVESMLETTDDPPGDLCSHSRSMIIQAISKVTLETVLSNFNTIVRGAILENDSSFFSNRGIKLNSVEVRSITCKNPETQKVLQEIIQETTNRLNKIQKQESENEVRIRQIKGEIEAEQMKGQFLSVKREHLLEESSMEGEAQAIKWRTFFSQLGTDLTEDNKMKLFQTLKKAEILGRLSEGKANLYFTPSDVDLSIETRTNPPGGLK